MTNALRLLAGSAVVLALATLSAGKSGDNGNAAGANSAVASTGNATGSATAPPAAPSAPAVDPNEKRMAIEALPVAQAGPGAIVGKMHMIRSASGIETDGIGIRLNSGVAAAQEHNRSTAAAEDPGRSVRSWIR